MKSLIKRLFAMAFVMIASSAIIQAKNCTIQLKNLTGYAILQNDSAKTTFPTGTTYSTNIITNGGGYYNIWEYSPSLLLSDGNPNRYLGNPPTFGSKSCPDSRTIYVITIDASNEIKFTIDTTIAAPAAKMYKFTNDTKKSLTLQIESRVSGTTFSASQIPKSLLLMVKKQEVL